MFTVLLKLSIVEMNKKEENVKHQNDPLMTISFARNSNVAIGVQEYIQICK